VTQVLEVPPCDPLTPVPSVDGAPQSGQTRFSKLRSAPLAELVNPGSGACSGFPSFDTRIGLTFLLRPKLALSFPDLRSVLQLLRPDDLFLARRTSEFFSWEPLESAVPPDILCSLGIPVPLNLLVLPCVAVWTSSMSCMRPPFS